MSAPPRVGEYETEPIRGLPEELPEGEQVLWQGSPEPVALARRALHTRKVAVYFAVLVALRLATVRMDGVPAGEGMVSTVTLVGLALLALALLHGLAWLSARAAIYTITNRRVVIRHGVALNMAVNLPFEAIQSASLRSYPDGTADVPLHVEDAKHLGYLLMWPHARPWRFGRACEPMLRCLPDAEAVVTTLVRAIADASPGVVVEPRSDAHPLESGPCSASVAAG